MIININECIRLKHPIFPLGLLYKKVPGAMCETCNTWEQIRVDKFRRIFKIKWKDFKKEL